jgi:hypothetical protein
MHVYSKSFITLQMVFKWKSELSVLYHVVVEEEILNTLNDVL